MSNKRSKADGEDVGTVTSELRDHVELIISMAKKEAREMKEKATEEIAQWEAEKKDIYKTRTFEPIVKLNVGGTYMSTTLKTLTSVPDSTLGKMFSGHHDLPKDENGAYFIDRCPVPFAEVLAFLRSPEQYQVPVANEDAVALEADFFGLKSLLHFVPPPPTVMASITNPNVHLTITRSPERLWHMWSVGLGAANAITQIVLICKHGCGYGCPGGVFIVHGVRNFCAGRTIDPAQPKMPVGTTCAQCGQAQ
jgi:hypothetical protein